MATGLHHAPPQLLQRLFDLVQLTLRVHYATDEATVTMRLPSDELLGLQTLSEELSQDKGADTRAKDAGRSQCATCTCPGLTRAGRTRVVRRVSLLGTRRVHWTGRWSLRRGCLC